MIQIEKHGQAYRKNQVFDCAKCKCRYWADWEDITVVRLTERDAIYKFNIKCPCPECGFTNGFYIRGENSD